MAADDEFTVEESIELKLLGLNCVLEAVSGDPEPLFVRLRDELSLLLEQLRRGEVHPEYAEVQLEKISEMLTQWSRNNPLPPEYYE